MLQVKNLKKTYGAFSLDVSLEVQEGSITGLIGQNGVGKSTIFKAILGLIAREGGTIRLFGKETKNFDREDKERLGVVLPDSGFSNYLTIQDIIPILASLYPRFEEKRFLEKCRSFQLPLDKKIKEFSTGMKGKLKILTAISHGADFLFLDEPTAGLDVTARDELLDILREYMEEKENRSILISSHISTDLEGLCDDLYMIQDGRIVLHEDTDVLLGDYALLKVTEEQYRTLEKRYLQKRMKQSYGYSCLTSQKQFYLENYPGITVENGSIDEVITMLVKGESI